MSEKISKLKQAILDQDDAVWMIIMSIVLMQQKVNTITITEEDLNAYDNNDMHMLMHAKEDSLEVKFINTAEAEQLMKLAAANTGGHA